MLLAATRPEIVDVEGLGGPGGPGCRSPDPPVYGGAPLGKAWGSVLDRVWFQIVLWGFRLVCCGSKPVHIGSWGAQSAPKNQSEPV